MSELPIVDPADPDSSDIEHANAEIPDDRCTITAVVLAGGTSSRYGESNKLLADVDGRPIVGHAVRTLVGADVSPIVVVLGHEATRIREALGDLPVSFVENPAYEDGQSTSVETGLRAVDDEVDAVIFALGDMPFVSSETIERLIDTYEASAGTALAPAYEGERGNPVLFDRTHFDELRSLSGDRGGRRVLLDAEEGVLVETGDPGVRRDVDEPTDLPD